MAHDENGAAVALEEVLEPAHALEVEVVGGLVEQEYLRGTQEQLGKRDAHLPASGELVGRTLHVLLVKAEAEEHASRLRLDVVAIPCLEARAQASVFREEAVGTGFVGALHLALEGLEPASHLGDVGDARHDLLQHASTLHLDGLLLEISRMGVT